MIFLRQNLAQNLSKAVSKAFPVSDLAEVSYLHRRADYTSSIPRILFEKYKTDTHTFGLFNPRELADSIFVNCSKDPWIKQVQISGTGELEIFIDEAYIKDALNSVINEETVSIERKNLKRAFVLVVDHGSVSEARALGIIEGIRRMLRFLGGEAEILLGVDGSKVRELASCLEIDCREFNVITEVDEQKLEGKKYGKVLRLLENFEGMHTNDSHTKRICVLYNYYSFAIKSIINQAIYDKIDINRIDYLSFGDVFTDLLPTNPNISFDKFLSSLTPTINSSVLKYLLLSHPAGSTFAINSAALSRKTPDSLWLILSVYTHITPPSHADHLSLAEIHSEVRAICMHLLAFPDTIEECISKSSCHYLILWTQKLCELYILSESRIPPHTKSKIDFLLKLFIDVSMNLLNIRLSAHSSPSCVKAV